MSPAQERLVAALELAGQPVRRHRPHEVRSRCPAHEGQSADSLSVTGTEGQVLVHCFGGCETREVIATLGLTMADLYDEPGRASYDYFDTAGTLARRVHRTHTGTAAKATYRQEVHERGTTTLYRAPQVLDAAAAGRPVHVVEGEKDVHALETLGAVATTSPGGASNWGKVDITPLTGADVVVVPDKDEAGARYLRDVLASLEGRAASVRVVRAKVGKDAADHVAAGYGIEDLVPEPGPASEPEPAQEESSRRSAAAVLVDLAVERYDFAVTEDVDAFAIPKASGHVVRPLRGGSPSLRAEMARDFRRATGRVAGAQALSDALLAIEGEAQESDPRPVALRAAEHRGASYIDLGDADERVVRITAEGWSVVHDDVPVLFRRTKLTGALPEPQRGGSLTALFSVINVSTLDQPLALAWLVAALVAADIPHPILAVFGEQGSGKSTCSRTLVSLVDPSPVELRKPPRDPDGWVTAAAGSWVVGLDNISALPDWLSDSLCRAATGDGDVRRALYTDGGLAVFAFRRCILLNGIDVGAMRGDLAERLLSISLTRLSERSRAREEDLNAALEAQRPLILGALLDLAANVKRRLPTIRLETSPRMADFAHILAAVDAELGTAGLARYTAMARTMAEDTLDADPFLVALKAMTRPFEGTAAQLLGAVTPTEDGWRAPREWPRSGRAVTGLLKRNAPALRSSGWVIEDLGASNKDHATRWQVTPPEGGGIRTSPPSPTSSSQVSGPAVARNGEVTAAARTSPTSPRRDPGRALTGQDEQASEASDRYGSSPEDIYDLLAELDGDDQAPGEPACATCGGPVSAQRRSYGETTCRLCEDAETDDPEVDAHDGHAA